MTQLYKRGNLWLTHEAVEKYHADKDKEAVAETVEEVTEEVEETVEETVERPKKEGKKIKK